MLVFPRPQSGSSVPRSPASPPAVPSSITRRRHLRHYPFSFSLGARVRRAAAPRAFFSPSPSLDTSKKVDMLNWRNSRVRVLLIASEQSMKIGTCLSLCYLNLVSMGFSCEMLGQSVSSHSRIQEKNFKCSRKKKKKPIEIPRIFNTIKEEDLICDRNWTSQILTPHNPTQTSGLFQPLRTHYATRTIG